MMRVISSPSISTTGFLTLILDMGESSKEGCSARYIGIDSLVLIWIMKRRVMNLSAFFSRRLPLLHFASQYGTIRFTRHGFLASKCMPQDVTCPKCKDVFPV